MKSPKFVTFLTVAAALMAAVEVNAGEKSTSPALSVLSATSSAELPSKAAELVSQSDAKNLKPTTIDVVKAAVGLNPGAAAAIVGSISQATPAAAPTAAATAAALVPGQALVIAKAAAAAAPTQAGAIVEAMCRVMPRLYQKIGEAVAQVVPGAGREILMAISQAIPTLKDSVDRVLAGYSGAIPSVSTALAQVSQAQNATMVATLAGSGANGSFKPITTPVMPVPAAPQGPSPVDPQVPIISNPVINPTNGTPTPGPNYSSP
ncbi:MAG TPA: hypothetical protein VF988_12910 [Verrucomicrobiae bacterium]